MAEYIDRGIAIAKLTALEVTERNATMTSAKRMLAYMPAADVAQVVHGRWLNITRFNDGERIIATCSRCKDRGDIRTIRTEFGIWEIDSPYCPNCGAKMDGGVDDACL